MVPRAPGPWSLSLAPHAMASVARGRVREGEGSGGGMQVPLPQSQHAAWVGITYRSSSAMGGVRDYQLHILQAACDSGFQEAPPGPVHLSGGHRAPQHQTHSGAVHPVRHQKRLADHTAALADFQVHRVRPGVRPDPVAQRPCAKRRDLLIETRGHAGHLGPSHPPGPHCLARFIDLPGGHAEHIGLADDIDERLLPAAGGAPARMGTSFPFAASGWRGRMFRGAFPEVASGSRSSTPVGPAAVLRAQRQ